MIELAEASGGRLRTAVTKSGRKLAYLTRAEREAFEDFIPPGRGHLSRLAILRQMELGNIIIEPYDPRCVNTTSVDVRLGHYFFRETRRGGGDCSWLNPFDPEHITRHWGEPCLPVNAGAFMKENGVKLVGIKPSDWLIILAPGETILAHTSEFIGGRNCVSTEMRARSTIGRIGITVCKCAGWGDLSFFCRWTKEMTNHLRDSDVILVVGMRTSQIIFFMVDPTGGMTYANTPGSKYQLSDSLREVMRTWTPYALLPKMFKDRETREGFPLPVDFRRMLNAKKDKICNLPVWKRR
jgi:dCTP deaminase